MDTRLGIPSVAAALVASALAGERPMLAGGVDRWTRRAQAVPPW